MLKFLHRKHTEFVSYMNTGDGRQVNEKPQPCHPQTLQALPPSHPTPTPQQVLIDDFVTFLNSLSEEQRTRDEIKAELHLRASTLQTKVMPYLKRCAHTPTFS